MEDKHSRIGLYRLLFDHRPFDIDEKTTSKINKYTQKGEKRQKATAKNERKKQIRGILFSKFKIGSQNGAKTAKMHQLKSSRRNALTIIFLLILHFSGTVFGKFLHNSFHYFILFFLFVFVLCCKIKLILMMDMKKGQISKAQTLIYLNESRRFRLFGNLFTQVLRIFFLFSHSKINCLLFVVCENGHQELWNSVHFRSATIHWISPLEFLWFHYNFSIYALFVQLVFNSIPFWLIHSWLCHTMICVLNEQNVYTQQSRQSFRTFYVCSILNFINIIWCLLSFSYLWWCDRCSIPLPVTHCIQA